MKNIIIGTGPAGRLAGLELGKLDEDAILIEKKYIAGSCLNEGCMVTCALVDIGRFLNTKSRFENLGLLKGNIGVDYEVITDKIKKTQEIIRELDQKENESANNQIIYGEAQINKNYVKVNGESFEYENLLIATGSRPFIPDIPGKENYLTNQDILKLKNIPDKVNVVGGGPIAAELSNIFSSFGSKVNIIARGKFLNNLDADLREFTIKKLLNNVKIYEGYDIVEVKENKIIAKSNDKSKNTDEIKEFEGKSFAATGRIPNSEIAKDLVELDKKGFIKVNEMMQTTKEGVYAAGDVIGGINLTTVARIEGITAARNMAGYLNKIEYNNIPQALTLDMDVGFTVNNNSKELSKESSKDNEMSLAMTGSAGPGGFWRVLTKDTGLTKIKFDKNNHNLSEVSAISPSAVSDVAYLSYLMRIGENMKDIDEFIEIHPSTDIFHKLLKEVY
ncbi:MAG: NAD(P)/FAD-dependent oxidoreductase [Methanobrevibacter sp.]|jgi:dihydrolipoamide dehydrogenase|nr:NAD(P)/FAD-dependent oxidoreductase [Methanobrevibacter sp.]